ncbi:DMT family transporter [Roseomonas sp. OT10]|uniref:DMT family transporter n=1 Tax=Roseomonas cutis TaxID=2897332 RepID=UPI001E4553FF|nr:DMT family transporter [Roseomonas sp. OT10]UFN51295.1 DMT family transporter [Roseomonas sp. OT10]
MTDPPPRPAMRHDIRRGALLMLGATLTLTLMGALVKLLSARIPFLELMVFRNMLALPVVLAIAATRPGGVRLRTKRPLGHLVRALTGLCGMGLSFYTLTLLPLADQTVLSYTQPLFVILLAIPFLGERPGPRRWVAVLTGFAGVMVVALGQGALGGGSAPAWAYFLAAAQGAVAATTVLMVRQLSGTETSTTIVLWQSMLMTAITATMLPFVWVPPTGQEWLLLLIMGLLGGLGQVLLTEAFASALVSALGAYSYSGLIWAMLIGLLVFGDAPGLAMLGGAALIVAAGLVVLRGEGRKQA